MKNKISKKSLVFNILVIVLAVLITSLVVKAGDLIPSSSPSSSMKSLEEIYNPLVATFDSSGVSASSTGSALQIAKCAITKIQGGSCE